MMTCRCNMCGTKNAGKAGTKSFGVTVWRDEHGCSEVGRDRRAERRLRRTREKRAWKAELD